MTCVVFVPPAQCPTVYHTRTRWDFNSGPQLRGGQGWRPQNTYFVHPLSKATKKIVINIVSAPLKEILPPLEQRFSRETASTVLFIAERQAEIPQTSIFCSPWFDPTGNRTRLYRFSSRHSIHSVTKMLCVGWLNKRQMIGTLLMNEQIFYLSQSIVTEGVLF